MSFKSTPTDDSPDSAVSRREVVRAAAFALGSGTLASLASTRGDESTKAADDARLAAPATGAIDAHVHVWTPDTERYPLAAGFRRDEMQPPSFTPQELFAHAGPCGVARIVLIQMSYYGFDNSYMLDTLRRFPGVFSGVAVIDEKAPDPPAEMRRLAARGVRGFRIQPRDLPPERWLGGEGMRAMWRCGAEDGLAMCHLVNPDALRAIHENCGKFPDTPVVIDHFARIGIGGAIRTTDVDRLCGLAKHRRTYVKLSAFYALGEKRAPYTDLIPTIRRLCDAFGPERLMWASDCPYQVQAGHHYADSIALVRDRLDFLSRDEHDWLLRKTAEKVFFS